MKCLTHSKCLVLKHPQFTEYLLCARHYFVAGDTSEQADACFCCHRAYIMLQLVIISKNNLVTAHINLLLRVG